MRRCSSFLGLGCLVLLAGCAVVDRPLLGLRGVAGGIHNRRRPVGIRPFFLPGGRLGFCADGALFLERPGGPPERILDGSAALDDPYPSQDGTRIYCVSGTDQVTAGGGHNDHVFQVYEVDLEDPGLRRLTRSRRAELLPVPEPHGPGLVFVRRSDYEPHALYGGPWGPGGLVVLDLESGEERVLMPPRFYPFHGLDFWPEGGGLVFGAVREDGGADVWALDYPGGGDPRLVVSDARLPVPLPGGRLLVVRDEPDRGSAVWVVDEGSVMERVLGAAGEITALAVGPEGVRLAFVELDREAGRGGVYALWEGELGDESAARTVHTLGGRSPKRVKVLDVVMPVGWWFRKDEHSPGSR